MPLHHVAFFSGLSGGRRNGETKENLQRKDQHMRTVKLQLLFTLDDQFDLSTTRLRPTPRTVWQEIIKFKSNRGISKVVHFAAQCWIGGGYILARNIAQFGALWTKKQMTD